MAKKQTTLKLPNDLIGNLRALLNTPPMPKKGKRKAKAPKVTK